VEIGLDSSMIAVRLRAGRLHRLHRGVYAVMPRRLLPIKARWLAAVLACGTGARLSHLDAAALWELCRLGSGPIHVSLPSNNGRRKRPGIVLHRSSTLLPSHTTVEDSIPVTKPERTLDDLCRMLPAARFAPSSAGRALAPEAEKSMMPTEPSSSAASRRCADATPSPALNAR
jgi:predicted transcriptional regulator of viral defense system